MNNYKNIWAFILLLSIGFLFMNYGNINSHPTINGLIVEKFISVNNIGNMPVFEDYSFKLYKPKLKGSYITKTGYFNPSNSGGSFLGDPSKLGMDLSYTEETREITPQKWIEHGGFAADIPEIPASLRHFYDPSKKENERYLTDKLNSKAMQTLMSYLPNPKTNGVDWALGTSGNFDVLEHIYTWENGKRYMKGALEQPNIEIRNNYMAKAWRSLGETLHMIADNGCPPHVRNDGHPPFIIEILQIFGNPDPYEELMEVKDIRKFAEGSIPFNLRNTFRKAKTTRDIAHALAVFTNENFFTNETISGTDWRGNKVFPLTNPEYIHKSPKISLNNYDNRYYKNKIGDIDVLLCTDKWFFGEYNIPSNIPHVDEKCVESQAKVLIPTIKEAGVNVMKLFIPKLTITINKISEDGIVSGIVKHETDKEYTTEIRYNGPLKLINGRSEISEIDVSRGQFTGQIGVDKNVDIVAQIEFGGISVHSKSYKFEKKEEMEVPKEEKLETNSGHSGHWVLYDTKEINGCQFFESECWPLEDCSGGEGSFNIVIGSSTCGSKAAGYSGSGTYTVPPSTLYPGKNYSFKATAEGRGYTSINIRYYSNKEKMSFDKKGNNTGDSSDWNERIVKNKNSPREYAIPVDLNKGGVLLIDAGGSTGSFETSKRYFYLYKWQK